MTKTVIYQVIRCKDCGLPVAEYFVNDRCPRGALRLKSHHKGSNHWNVIDLSNPLQITGPTETGVSERPRTSVA